MLHHFIHLALSRPDVRKENRLALTVFAQRIFSQINVDSPGQRKSDYQRRRHQIIGANIWINPSLEIAIARKHRGNDEILTLDFFRNLLRQRPRISDAGGASVADNMELELLEIRH